MSGDDKGKPQGPAPGTQIPLELQQPPKLNKAQEMMIQRVIEKSKNSNKVKRVRFKSKAKADVKVQDLGLADNVTLGKYMTLPAEQWVTLDEQFISRLDSGDDDREVEYRFTMPLMSLMQLPLTATCDVSVEVDGGRGEVVLSGVGARLRPCTPEDGDGPKVPEGQQQQPPPLALPANATNSIQLADLQVSFETKLKWTEGGKGLLTKAETNGSLALSTAVEVEITLPPPLSFFPGWLLRQGGALVLKAVSASMLPRFGELVAEDFRRWSNGLPRLGTAMSANISTVSGSSLELAGLGGPNPYYTPPPASLSSPVNTSATPPRPAVADGQAKTES